MNPLDDYPDIIVPFARAVAAGEVTRGIAICGSGVGASVCANKVPGVRAGLVHEHFSAHQGVQDDNMNVICMGGRTGAGRGLGSRSYVSCMRVQWGPTPRTPSGQGSLPGTSSGPQPMKDVEATAASSSPMNPPPITTTS